MAIKKMITCSWCGKKAKSYGEKYCCRACYDASIRAKTTEKVTENTTAREIKQLKAERTTLRRQLQSLEKEVASYDTLVERCIPYVTALKPPAEWKPSYPKGKKYTKQTATLLFSDCQLGERFTMEETGGLNTYTVQIFKKRLEYLCKKIIKITDMQRKSIPINDLAILMLGDIVENESIFRGQGGYIEEGVLDQMFHGIEYISNFIRTLAGHFEHITIPCVSGNHGRINDTSKFYCNWDFIFYKFLEQVLQDVKNVSFYIPKAWWIIQDIQGWLFYMIHGDTIPRYMSIPWYGLERMDGRTEKMLRSKEINYDYFVMGHHHQAFDWDASHGERMCNGSFSSGNMFASKELALMSPPTQMFFGVHPEQGITWRYKIRLNQAETEK